MKSSSPSQASPVPSQVCTQKEQEAPVPHETVQQYVPEQGFADMHFVLIMPVALQVLQRCHVASG